jgi:hypothetical protein
MRRLITPLVYILGFSVFCACTTTKSTAIQRVSPSNEERNLELVLAGGERLAVQSAIITPDDVQGEVAEKDSRRLAAYFQSWQSEPARPVLSDGAAIRWTAHRVTIPRSDISHIVESSDWAVMGNGALAVIGVLLIAGGIAALISVKRQCDESGWC